MPELSDEEKEDIVISIIRHFENPEPVSPPYRSGRKYGSKYKKRSSSYKGIRKGSSSDKENDNRSRSLTPVDHASGQKTGEENAQSEITKSHENGVN